MHFNVIFHVAASAVLVLVALYATHLRTDTDGFVPAEQLVVEPGDIIEMTRLLYRHFGLYVGNGEVVHIHVSLKKLNQAEGIIVKTNLSEEGAAGYYFRVNNVEDEAALLGLRARPTEDVVKDALEMVGKIIPYNMVVDNCEHIVTGWKYGHRFSVQVTTVFLQPSLLAENLFRYVTGAHPIVLHRTFLFVVPFIIYLMLVRHSADLANVVEGSEDWARIIINNIKKKYFNQAGTVHGGGQHDMPPPPRVDGSNELPKYRVPLRGLNNCFVRLNEDINELQNQAISSLNAKIVKLESENELLKSKRNETEITSK